LVGGPIGAVVGAAAGGAGGATLKEGVDDKVERAVDDNKSSRSTASGGGSSR
jgi:hypothetical protein